jgi:ankyrin repeat protein
MFDRKDEPIRKLPIPSVLFQVISTLLTADEAALFSSTSRAHRKEISKAISWKDKIVALGYKKDLLPKKADSTDADDAKVIIKNYQKLYSVLRTNKKISFAKITSPWELCCLSGEIAAIEYAILHLGITPQMQSASGLTILHYVAWSGSAEAIEHVLQIEGIDPLAEDNNGRTALHFAALSGSVEAIERILQIPEVYPLVQDDHGCTVLHFAALSGSVKAIDCALQIEGINPQALDNKGRSVVHFAAWSGIIEAVKLSIEKYGRFPILRDYQTCTLYYAAASNSSETIKYLLDTNMRIYDKCGRKEMSLDIPILLLHAAAACGSKKALEIALENLKKNQEYKDQEYKDINPFQVDNLGLTVWHLVAASGSREALEHALQIEGFDPLARDRENKTILHHAAASRSRETFERALKIEGIDPLATDRDGRTAVHHAAASGSREVLECALQIKSVKPLAQDNDEGIEPLAIESINPLGLDDEKEVKPLALAQDNDDRTVLHLAAASGSREAFERALKIEGIIPLTLAANGRSVLTLATASGSKEAIEGVLECKAANFLTPDVIPFLLLHAASSGSKEAVERTLQIPGVDLLSQGLDGRNVLHVTARSGSVRTIFFLHSLQGGLDPRTVDRDGFSAYPYEKNSENKACTALRLVEADLDETFRIKTNKAIGSLSVGLAFSYGLVKTGIIAATTPTLLLTVCCTGALGALIIALIIHNYKNNRYGFFETARNPLLIQKNLQRNFYSQPAMQRSKQRY